MPAPRRLSPRSTALSGAFLFLLVFGIYVATHCASVFLDDSGETITVAAVLGIGHPPGYPFHSLLGHLATVFWPYGGPAEAVNLLAALMGASAACLVGLLGLAWTAAGDPGAEARMLALLPALLMALGPVWWHNALGAKGGIYQLNNLLSVAMVALLAAPGTAKARRLAAFWLLLGLSMAHHYMSQLTLLPAYAWLLWPQRRQAWRSAWLLIPGLALYLYLPLRAATGPALNWGNIGSWRDFWFFFFRLQYTSSEWTRSSSTSLAQARHALGLLLREGSWILPPLAAVGAWRGRGRRVEQALSLGWLATLAAVTFYLNLQPDRLDLMRPYLFPAYLCQALLASRALEGMLPATPSARRAILSAALAGILGWAGLEWPGQDLSRYHAALDNARGLLLGLPRDSLLLAQGDAQIFPLWYLQRVRLERPDVAVVGLAVLPMEWVRQDLARRYPDLRHPTVLAPIGAESIPRLTQAYLELNGQRPLYAGFNQWPGDEGSWRLVSEGPAFRAVNGPLTQTVQDRALARGKLLARALRGLTRRPMDSRTRTLVVGDLAVHFNCLGVAAEEAGSFPEALGFYQDAARWDPDSPDYPFNQGNVFNAMHQTSLAADAYRDATQRDPNYANAWYNLGVTLYQSGRMAEARDAFSRYLRLEPDHPEVRQVLQQLGG